MTQETSNQPPVTTGTPATTVTPDGTQTPPVTAQTPPAEFAPDATKSPAENEAAKVEWQKQQDALKAAETPEAKAAREKTEKDAADAAAKDKANDTKANPFKAEEIKLPEGFQVDPTISGKFVELVNKFGIPRNQVAELVTLQADAMKAASEAGSKAFADMQAGWQKELQADTAIGGEKLAPALASISKMVDQADDPAALRAAMDLTGAGNNPAIVKWLSKLSANFVEPGSLSAGNPNNPEMSAADRIYGKK